jgi:ribosome-binding factor A
LNYVPRERTLMGRTFEHAADSKVMIDQLTQIVDVENLKDTNFTTFFVKIVDESQVSTSKDGKSVEDEKNLVEMKLAEKFQTRIFDDLKIKQEHIILSINKPFI